ncbi:MAG: hypothetical protein NTY06_01000, partial [Candidatus Gottesmanbacteria bacterium]|nr:hypothetical protein [Candidatus Gottesmanbacteria bacterium]
MHKFVQITIPSGKSKWEYRVNKGVKLSLTFTSYSSFDARVTVTLAGVCAPATITGTLIGKGNTRQVLHTM